MKSFSLLMLGIALSLVVPSVSQAHDLELSEYASRLKKMETDLGLRTEAALQWQKLRLVCDLAATATFYVAELEAIHVGSTAVGEAILNVANVFNPFSSRSITRYPATSQASQFRGTKMGLDFLTDPNGLCGITLRKLRLIGDERKARKAARTGPAVSENEIPKSQTDDPFFRTTENPNGSTQSAQ